jgi:hypothetical protein
MGELAKIAQKISPFLKIPDNDSVIVMYKGFKTVEDSRDPTKIKLRYTVELDGEDKWFESGSSRIALFFDTILEGQIVEIKRVVTDGKVRYEVEKYPKESEGEEKAAGKSPKAK